MHFLLVALGGAIGATFRHLVGILTLKVFGPGFPWGTFTANILGSFIMGVIVELIARKFNASIELRLFLMTGLLGGFTTFSSFSLDTVFLWQRGETVMAFVYVLASVAFAIAALFAGLAVVRNLI